MAACSEAQLCPYLNPLISELKEADAASVLDGTADRSLLRTAIVALALPLREAATSQSFQEREE